MVALLVGCGKKANDGPSPTTDTAITQATPWQDRVSFKEKTGPDGILELEVEVGVDHDAMLVSASDDDYFVGVERLLDPSGEVVLHWQDWWTSNLSLTASIFGESRTVGFNWPIRPEEGLLTPGTWTVELFAVNNMGDYQSTRLEGAVYLKDDDDFSASEVPVNIVYAQGTDKPKIKDAVEVGIERWREVWDAHGLTLVEAFHTSDAVSANLDFGYEPAGSSAIEALAKTLPPGELVLIIGETIDGDTETYGLAAGIPGTLEATSATWVLTSWLAHSGPDGNFNDEEKQMMGETMAHEIGHYSGLFHPVECPYDCVAEWDALDDTADCVGWQDCEAELGSNLMYPYPVCTFYGCEPAGDLSIKQVAVWQRYTGAR